MNINKCPEHKITKIYLGWIVHNQQHKLQCWKCYYQQNSNPNYKQFIDHLLIVNKIQTKQILQQLVDQSIWQPSNTEQIIQQKISKAINTSKQSIRLINDMVMDDNRQLICRLLESDIEGQQYQYSMIDQDGFRVMDQLKLMNQGWQEIKVLLEKQKGEIQQWIDQEQQMQIDLQYSTNYELMIKLVRSQQNQIDGFIQHYQNQLRDLKGQEDNHLIVKLQHQYHKQKEQEQQQQQQHKQYVQQDTEQSNIENKTVKYKNGVYEGSFRNEIRDGRGVYRWEDENRYEGEWKDGDMQGYGIYYYNNGGRYEGEWKNNRRDGKGVYYYTNGGRYEGDYQNNTMQGYGVYHYSNGNRYEGQYKDDKRNGYGVFEWNDQSIYDGHRYEGDWKDGRMHGKGVYYYPNGGRYEGEYMNDKQHGKGLDYYTDGTTAQRYYEEGKLIKQVQSSD